MVEIAVIATICILSYVLILRNLDFAVYVLILLSVLLHKELFSFYRWDLMPIRAFFQTKRSCCGIDSSVVGCAFDINSKFEEHPVLRIFDGIFHDIDRDVPAPLFHVQKPT